jgi:formyl-CoA transferase
MDDQHSDGADGVGQERRALDGVRVLDLTHQVAGPSSTLVLAFLGAEVVKVIAPGSRDSYDAIPFYLNNVSKKSVELDLKSEAGLRAALRLAEKADIFVENFSPGVIDRLGLGWDVLSALNPRLIYAQVKGFAEDSPYRDYPCFDPIAQGFSGGSSVTGEPDGLPMKPGPDVGDTGTGMVLVGAILAALYQREKDGLGQRLQIAMTDQVATFMRIHYGWPIQRAMDTPRFGNRPPFLVTTAPSDIYPCPPFGPSDFVHIHCGSDRQWERMAKLMDREDMLGDERFATMASRGEHKAEMDEAVRAWTGTMDKMAAMRALGEAGVPAGALRTTTEVLNDADMRARGIFVTVDDPGRGEVTVPGYPVRMSRSPAVVTPPPRPGEHTWQVLREWLDVDTVAEAAAMVSGEPQPEAPRSEAPPPDASDTGTPEASVPDGGAPDGGAPDGGAPEPEARERPTAAATGPAGPEPGASDSDAPEQAP